MARTIPIWGGTGPEGTGLAYRLAKAGECILIGSRDAARAQETAKQLRERVRGAQIEGKDNPSAVAACDIAILTVPFSGAAGGVKKINRGWERGGDEGEIKGGHAGGTCGGVAPRGCGWVGA